MHLQCLKSIWTTMTIYFFTLMKTFTSTSPPILVSLLCLALNASTFSCCLFVCLSVFSFVFINWKVALSHWDQLTGLAIGEYYIYLPSANLRMLSQHVLVSLSICNVKCRPIIFAPFGWHSAASTDLRIYFRIHHANSVSSHIINKTGELPVPLETTDVHNVTSTMFERWFGIL